MFIHSLQLENAWSMQPTGSSSLYSPDYKTQFVPNSPEIDHHHPFPLIMPPKGSGGGSGKHVRQAVTKKTKGKKSDKDAKPPRPKVLEREAKKQAAKEKKEEKREKAIEDREMGVTRGTGNKKQDEKNRGKDRKKDRAMKADRLGSGED